MLECTPCVGAEGCNELLPEAPEKSPGAETGNDRQWPAFTSASPFGVGARLLLAL